MTAGTTVIVPVKGDERAKRRLAHVLGVERRRALIDLLLEHVLDVVEDCGADPIVVATDARILPRGVQVLVEEQVDLNTALRRTLADTPPPVAVLAADLPWLRTQDLEALLATPGDVVVARSADGGTTGLLLRRYIPPSFGGDSALMHARAAHRAGFRVRTIDRDGFTDLDDTRTLVRAFASPVGARLRRAVVG